jgi:hypothetical protein
MILERKKAEAVCPGFFFIPLRSKQMAGRTGIEPVTSDVTGRRSNQLNYRPRFFKFCVQSSQLIKHFISYSVL